MSGDPDEGTYDDGKVLIAGVLYDEETGEEAEDVCPLDGEPYDREWDLDHEEHDSEHPNHYRFCDDDRGHYHDGEEIVYTDEPTVSPGD